MTEGDERVRRSEYVERPSDSQSGQHCRTPALPRPQYRLRAAFGKIKKAASPGVDGVTWEQYERDLEANLRGLHSRLQRGVYRAKPSRRAYIPKPDGRQRPLGIAALEDKIAQRAAGEVLNAIYEVDFLGFSYGFRPGRRAHVALDALAVGIRTRKIS